MEIQVDFEGRYPIDSDFHGIKTLLQRLFLKSYIDVDSLTDFIIKQNYIGSVIKQSTDEQQSDDEDDDDINDVFGVTTVVNITEKNDVPCIHQLRTQLVELAEEHANADISTMIQNLLESDSTKLGLLINERFVNIPAQISAPLLENLMCEIRRAVTKKMPFDFTHYILICKMYKPKGQEKSNKKNETKDSEIIWSNPEEEIFAEMATMSFEFSVEKKFDSGLSGHWSEDDEELIPYRRVLLFEAVKLPNIVEAIKNQISPTPIIKSN